METEIKSPYIITGGVAIDDRGLIRFVNDFSFMNVKRFYQVQNYKRGFIRAWHGHIKESKYVYVIKGSALIGAVKLSETAQDINSDPQKFILSSYQPKILYIPPCYANGFMNLEEDTIVQFFSTTTLEESQNDDYRFEYNKWDIWKENFR